MQKYEFIVFKGAIRKIFAIGELKNAASQPSGFLRSGYWDAAGYMK
jgi:hypothetical protein